MYQQPKHHPDSTPAEIARCELAVFIMCVPAIFLPLRWTARNEHAAQAVVRYQRHCLDSNLLRAEISARNSRSPVFRLARAAKAEAAAIAEDERRETEQKDYLRVVIVYWSEKFLLLGGMVFLFDEHSLAVAVARWFERLLF